MAREMIEWRFVHFGSENDGLELGGLPVWREAWREALEPVFLSDPIDPGQRHRLGVYAIGPADSPVCFAAGEFSNGIWGFFISAHDWRYRVVDVISGEGLGKIILLAGPTDLPTGAEVTVRLTMPDGAVVEVTGLKAWELAVDGPPFEQDAFLLTDVDLDIPKGALAEVVELGQATGPVAHVAHVAHVAPPSLPSPEPALIEDARSPPDIERDIPEGFFAEAAEPEREIVPPARGAGEGRTLLSPQERARLAAIGNAGLKRVVTEKYLEPDHRSPEPDHGPIEPDFGPLQADHGSPQAAHPAEALLPVGDRTILILWIVYALSAAFVLFRLKNTVLELIGLFHILKFFGEAPKDYEYTPFIWLGVSIFYLAIGPVAILKLNSLRHTRV